MKCHPDFNGLQLLCANWSPGALVKRLILVGLGGAWESAFLAGSQAMLAWAVHKPHFEYQRSNEAVERTPDCCEAGQVF